MALDASGSFEFSLLTSTVFASGAGERLIGEITPFSLSGKEQIDGMCFVAALPGRGTFIHPTLFRSFRRDNTSVIPAAITMLEGDMLELKWDVEGPGSDQRVRTEPAATAAEVSIEEVISFIEVVTGAGECHWYQDERENALRSCDGAKSSPLDPKRSIWLTGRPDVVCTHCFRRLLQNNPEIADNVIFDGRWLQHRAKVPVFGEP